MFKINQVGARQNDFDIIRPYKIMPFAISYPLCERRLQIGLSSSVSEEVLGSFKLD